VKKTEAGTLQLQEGSSKRFPMQHLLPEPT